MIRFIHIIPILLFSNLLFGQSSSVEKLIAMGDFNTALQVADTPLKKIQCLVEMDQFQDADSLLELSPIETKNPLYSEYCLYQAMTKRKLRQSEAALDWVSKGLNNKNNACAIKGGFMEIEGFILVTQGSIDKGKLLIEAALKHKINCAANAYEIIKSYRYLSTVAYYEKNYPQAIEYLDKGIKLSKNLSDPNFLTASLYGNKGVMLKKLGDLNSALTSYLKEIEIKKQFFDTPFNPALFTSYNNISIIHSTQRNYKEFELYLDTLEAIVQNSSNDPTWLANIYTNKSITKINLDEKERIIRQILPLKEKFLPTELTHIVTAYTTLSEIAYRRNNKAACENYLNEAMKTLESIPNFRKLEKAIILRRIAMLEKERKNYKKAESLLLEGIQIFKAENRETHFRIRFLYLSLCHIYIETEQYEKAMERAKQMREITENAFGPTSTQVSSPIALIGKIETLRGNYNKAIPILNQAIKLAKDNEEMKYFVLDPSYEHLSICYAELGQLVKAKESQMKMLEIWNFETEELLLKNGDQVPGYFYSRAIQTLENHFKFKRKYDRITDNDVNIFLTLYNNLKSDFFFETSTLDLKENVKELVNLSIEQQLSAYHANKNTKHLNTIFKLIENYKSGLVDFKRKLEDYDKQLPNELLKKEQEIRYNFEHAFQEYKKSTSNLNSTVDSSLHNRLLKWQNRKIQFLEKIKMSYPDFYAFRKQNRINSLAEIQNKITQPNQKYLNYYWSKDFVVAMLLSSDNVKVFKINKEELKDATEELRSLLSYKTANNSENDYELNKATFASASFKLHQLLIAPIQDLIRKDDNLCIVPDGPLCYLPFDLLLTSKPKSDNSYKTLPYLVNEINISYSNSINTNVGFRNNTNSNSINYVGFAPDFEGTVAFNTFRGNDILYANKEEITFARKHFNGIGYYGSRASKGKFLEEAPKANILHLATHAIVNDEVPMNSSLQFFSDSTEQSLRVHEIAQLNLNNKLVVLSACETQSGKFANGEGLLSITRAFQLAGSHNLICTLWPVNDNIAENIIRNFWSHTDEGHATSLRKAKLQYLQNCSELYAHPFYWSSFVFQGQNQPIQQRNNTAFYIGFTLFLGVLGFLFLKFKK